MQYIDNVVFAIGFLVIFGVVLGFMSVIVDALMEHKWFENLVKKFVKFLQEE